MNQDILKVSRKTYRGADSEFVLECGSAKIIIRPTKLQRYDIMELIHGGGSGTTLLSCRMEIKELE